MVGCIKIANSTQENMIHDSILCTEKLDIWAVVVVEELEESATGVDGDLGWSCRPCHKICVEVDQQGLQIRCI